MINKENFSNQNQEKLKTTDSREILGSDNLGVSNLGLSNVIKAARC